MNILKRFNRLMYDLGCEERTIHFLNEDNISGFDPELLYDPDTNENELLSDMLISCNDLYERYNDEETDIYDMKNSDDEDERKQYFSELRRLKSLIDVLNSCVIENNSDNCTIMLSDSRK